MRFSKVGQSVHYMNLSSVYTIAKVDDHFYPANILIDMDGARFWTTEDKVELIDSGSKEDALA